MLFSLQYLLLINQKLLLDPPFLYTCQGQSLKVSFIFHIFSRSKATFYLSFNSTHVCQLRLAGNVIPQQLFKIDGRIYFVRFSSNNRSQYIIFTRFVGKDLTGIELLMEKLEVVNG